MRKTYSQEDIMAMGVCCDDKHDEEEAALKVHLSAMENDELSLSLYRYNRFNTRVEIIVRAEDDWNTEELVSMAFDKGEWSHITGTCSREIFTCIQAAVHALWAGISESVIREDENYGRVDDED